MSNHDINELIIKYRSTLKNNIIFNMPRKSLIYNNILWLSSYGDNCIYLIDIYTQLIIKTLTFTKLKNPRGICNYNKYIYIACFGDPIGNIICFDSETFVEILNFDVPRPRGLIISGEELFITEVMQHRISVYNLNGVLKRYIGTGLLHCPRGIAVNNENNIVIADSGNNRIVILNPNGNLIQSSNTIYAPNDVSCYFDKIFVSQWYDKCIRIYNPITNKFGIMNKSPQISGFFSMLYIYNHVIFVSDENGYLHIFDILF